MKPWLCALVVALPSVALAATPDQPEPADAVDNRPLDAVEPPAVVSHWADAHPAATFALVGWVQKSPESARQLFWWDRTHPLRARYFLRWAVEHPTGTVEEFETAHQKWPAVDLVLRPNHDAVDGLVAWARAHPAALQDLLTTPRGFAWVGFHPLHALWSSSQPPTSPVR